MQIHKQNGDAMNFHVLQNILMLTERNDHCREAQRACGPEYNWRAGPVTVLRARIPVSTSCTHTWQSRGGEGVKVAEFPLSGQTHTPGLTPGIAHNPTLKPQGPHSCEVYKQGHPARPRGVFLWLGRLPGGEGASGLCERWEGAADGAGLPAQGAARRSTQDQFSLSQHVFRSKYSPR